MPSGLDQLAEECSRRLAIVADDYIGRGDVAGGLMALGGAFLAAMGADALRETAAPKPRRIAGRAPRAGRGVSGDGIRQRRKRRAAPARSQVIDAEFVRL